MQENYLHFLWKNKRLPFHKLKTTDNNDLLILDVGTYNPNSGPDFFNGKIQIEGVKFNGNIEMHINASDWNAHGHQYDKAYNNVILHVVYKFDELIYIEGAPLPTVEIESMIDWEHYEKFIAFNKTSFQLPCSSMLQTVPETVFWSQINESLSLRLERKIQDITSFSDNPLHAFFLCFAKAFGMHVNSAPFEELSNRLPIDRVLKSNIVAKVAMLLGVSGLLQHKQCQSIDSQIFQEWEYQKSRLNLSPCKLESWKFKGNRPQGFPTIRIIQFANFLEQINFHEVNWSLPASKLLLGFQQALLVQPIYDAGMYVSSISKETANTILTNAMPNYLSWLAQKTQIQMYKNTAVELLELLPPEKNSIIDFWKKHSVIPRNAANTQGLLEQLTAFCNQKKCLSCKIGCAIMD